MSAKDAGLSALVQRLEAATGPDRELDLAIELGRRPDGEIAKLMQFRRGFDHQPGMAWDIHGQSVCFEKFTADGRCTYNGGIPLPRYTASLDAALTLVPDGWEWKVSNRASAPHAGRAYIHNGELINIGGGLTRNPRYRGQEVTAATPAIAICIAALKARAAAEPEPR